jgi:hypothetical protein
MFRDFFTIEKPTPVDDLIEVVRKEMIEFGPNEPEYTALMEKLERLHALKAERPKPISWDSIVIGGVHLIGVGILVFAERDTILSRAGSMQIGRVLK